MQYKKPRHKILIWVISKDEERAKMLRRALQDSIKKTRVDLMVSLLWAARIEEQPDIVFVDTNSINDASTDVADLADQIEYFMRIHAEAWIGLYSAQEGLAEALIAFIRCKAKYAPLDQVDFLNLQGMVDFVNKNTEGTACTT